jgi:tRNA pseudouridine38-40 synthase
LTRYFIKISFKGTNYKGWQVQSRSVTVQGTLENTLGLLLKEDISLTGAGRTDTGVHAMNYFAHFDSQNSELQADDDLRRKLNSFLPFDILVQDIFKVDNTAHARFDAISRTYHYVITRNKNPFLREFSHYVYWNIDVNAMNKACDLLIKHTDFTSFSKLHSNNKTNICRLSDAAWRETSDGTVVFRIISDRFLRGMVRAVTGTMLDIGSGKMDYREIERVFREKNRGEAGMSAPAEGLFLTDIRYIDGIIRETKNVSQSPVLPASDLFF